MNFDHALFHWKQFTFHFHPFFKTVTFIHVIFYRMLVNTGVNILNSLWKCSHIVSPYFLFFQSPLHLIKLEEMQCVFKSKSGGFYCLVHVNYLIVSLVWGCEDLILGNVWHVPCKSQTQLGVGVRSGGWNFNLIYIVCTYVNVSWIAFDLVRYWYTVYRETSVLASLVVIVLLNGLKFVLTLYLY